jgi:hypothetical protein
LVDEKENIATALNFSMMLPSNSPKTDNMNKYLLPLASGLLLVMAVISFSSYTVKPSDASVAKYTMAARWEKLGERKVNFAADRDEIAVGARDGAFDALKIKVRKGAINLHKMVVHFGNGETKEVELRNDIRAGGESRLIDLPGNNRVITKVVFWYDTKNRANRRAEVELWGKH